MRLGAAEGGVGPIVGAAAAGPISSSSESSRGISSVFVVVGAGGREVPIGCVVVGFATRSASASGREGPINGRGGDTDGPMLEEECEGLELGALGPKSPSESSS